MNIAIVGGGWAGLAAAVRAVQEGHAVTLFEAAHQPGGRARGVPLKLPDGRRLMLDNGQHILIGAYRDTLRLMRLVGVDPERVLLRLPLALGYADGSGLSLPQGPAPFDVLAGILRARGWSWRDRLALLRTALGWRLQGFACPPAVSVAELCAALTPRLREEFIEPLCVSALNTPMREASGQVFLRVLRDAMFSERGGSNLLLPRADLGTLFPQAAVAWLVRRGARVLTGCRVQALRPQAGGWQLDGQAFERVILATAPAEAARLAGEAAAHGADQAQALRAWAERAASLRFEAITTVYALARQPDLPTAAPLLPRPMLALRPGAQQPAQFVFDRGQLAGAEQAGLLAFVVSASTGERQALQAQVAAQAQAQLGLEVEPLQTIVEKRATFACTPGLARPPQAIASGLLAAGDHVAGPYPATLEGAVRSGWAAAGLLAQAA
ncbi:hydroxysqualene dehydroxylase HpnE [Ramlibacter sp. 2FC]|uniref:hydroxysqualene dehydroxylase HpnE n=1 Tax=Ramlibacter sp. 2FC TaxID=2502188 RepID=UPI0010F9FC46|nr:hydroxysqualene dehydroxylase HpnE [Ramlibacter sp. 2FC]